MTAPKVLIENQNALGQNVEQVTLDTNRVDIQRETHSRLANAVALSSRGLWIDCSQWIAYSAGFFSLAKLSLLSALPLWAIALVFGVPLFIFFVLLADVCQRRKSLRLHALTRFVLMVVGGAIAVS